MSSPAAIARRLAETASNTGDLPAWRARALSLVREAVPYDVGFFHELSPRAPLDRAALYAVEPSFLESTLDSWDEMAVAFEAFLADGLAHGGVALASRAFSGRTRERRLFARRVARPLRVVDLALVHLVVRNRVIAGVVLGRRARSGHFADRDQRALEKLAAPLAVCDALLQAGATPGPGMATTLECVDGRLTARQRQVVVHVALGHSNPEIATALGVSSHTVRNLLVTIQGRLGASNRAEVVHRAVFR